MFAQIPGESARAYALRYLTHQIVNLIILPGQKISDIEISKELNISRTPVREAILTLSGNGLIESYPQKGIFISLIDPSIVKQVCTMRRVVEGHLAEICCELIQQDQLDELLDCITLQRDYAAGGPRENLEKFLALDIAFHASFYRICEMDFIYNTMQNIMPHFDRQRKLSYQINVSHRIISEHAEICEAIKNQDKAAAKQLMSAHISTALMDQGILQEKFPDYFVKAL